MKENIQINKNIVVISVDMGKRSIEDIACVLYSQRKQRLESLRQRTLQQNKGKWRKKKGTIRMYSKVLRRFRLA